MYVEAGPLGRELSNSLYAPPSQLTRWAFSMLGHLADRARWGLLIDVWEAGHFRREFPKFAVSTT